MSLVAYKFQIGKNNFELSHKNAKELYNYLNNNDIFGVKPSYTRNNYITIQTKITIPNNDEEPTIITLDLDIIELKELYYTIKPIFENTVTFKDFLKPGESINERTLL